MTADPREIHRTRPDYVIHDPTGGRERPWDDDEFYWLNEHILVHPLGDGSLLGYVDGGAARRSLSHADRGETQHRRR